MKKIKLLSLILISILTACDFKNQNIDPNYITGDKLQLSNKLPTVEYYLANMLASDLPLTVNNTTGQTIYVQGTTGLNTYLYSTADPSRRNLWSRIYVDILFNANELIQLADKKNAPVYRGIARVSIAMAAVTASSIWGDVPYSQATQLETYLNPVFDRQEDVYARAQQMLDAAIGDFQNPSSNIPSKDDYIFQGDAQKWLKVAHALKARYYLHVVKKREDVYDLALSELNQSLTSNDQNCVLKYRNDGNTNDYHPLYNERAGTQNTQIDVKFTDLMKSKNDPRLPFYATVKNSLATGKRALYGLFYASKDSYVPLMTYEECLFMRAEIELYKSGRSAAQATFKQAIEASLNRVCNQSVGDGSEDGSVGAIPSGDATLNTYRDTYGDLTSLATDADAWKALFEQKYIALFVQQEVWNDYRRSDKYIPGVDGLPILTPRSGTQIPSRYPYPANESNYNKNTPADPGIYAKVWWDQ